MNDTQQLSEFSQVNVESNQSGLITEEQTKKLYHSQSQSLLSVILAAILCSIPFGWSIKQMLQGDLSLNTVMFAVIPLMIISIIATEAYYKWNAIQKDLQLAQIKYIEGRAIVGIKNSRNLQYKLTLDPLIFDISNELRKAVTNGAKYGIYFTPYSFTILSMKRLRSDNLEPALIDPRE